MSNDIFFSVMICCYNSEQYLKETIDSIVNQSYTNWEIIAVNDGSSDGTEGIIQNYIDKGIPIIYHYQENAGFANARNKAMSLASGDWIAIIDHDDVCLLDRLEIQSTHIRKNPNAKLFFANTIHFNNKGVEIRNQYDRFDPCELDLSKGKALNHLLIHGCFIDTESVVFNKEAALSIGGFDTEYKYVVDADFFKRMGSKYDMYAGEETIAKWRVHTNQATQKMESILRKESKQMFNKYFYFEGVTTRTRFSMIFYLLKSYIKKLLIKSNLLKNNISG
jgi:glycosyltransferase involved in cell wall biosynthesis